MIYKLYKIDDNKCIGCFKTKQDATCKMNLLISEYNSRYTYICDELTPFDFRLEEVECKEINKAVTTYEEARKYLGGKPNADFTVAQKILSGNHVKLDDVTNLVSEVNPKHIKALIAYNRLCTIAQAWNMADGFKPDFNNTGQYKYFPWFEYSKDAAGFVYMVTANTDTIVNASLGSRLCFKTSKRAMQFGKQFIDLWNDFLLNK